MDRALSPNRRSRGRVRLVVLGMVGLILVGWGLSRVRGWPPRHSEFIAAEAIRGRAAYLVGDDSRTIAAFETVLRSDPDLSTLPFPREEFWSALVESLVETGRASEASAILKARLDARGDDPILLDRLADVSLHEGRADEARSLWNRASDLNPRRAHPRLGLGRLALIRGNVDAAIAFLRVAASLAPDDPEIAYSLAQAYRRGGRLDEAEHANKIAERLRAVRPTRPRGMDRGG